MRTRVIFNRRVAVLLLLLILLSACAIDTTPLEMTATPSSGLAASTLTREQATAMVFTATPVMATALPASTPSPPPPPSPSPSPAPTVPAAVLLEAPGATLPAGFSMIKFADLYRPTGLAFAPGGALYATSFDGTVHHFVDANGDGRADKDVIFAYGFDTPLGVTVAPDGETVYVSSKGKISILRDTDDDQVANQVEAFVTGLPVGRHQNDNLKFGPNGYLFIGIGSTCDACEEIDRRSATIMRFNPLTGEGEVFATGMRNPYDLAFHPETGALFATDNGRDDLGLDAPHEELNMIVQGGDYGWPSCWNLLEGPACDGTVPAIAFFEAHSSANSVEFYYPGEDVGNPFPSSYTNSLFVGIFGSWLKSDVTTGLARVELSPTADGYEGDVSWFARWEGMPLGLALGPDGALYVGDYVNGAVYRISYGLP